jgi:hypothetical protein
MSMRSVKLAWVCLLGAVALSGCVHTAPYRVAVGETLPAPNETVVVDQVILISDGSGSMVLEDKFSQSKALIQSFVQAMPAGSYSVSSINFGGEWKQDWQAHPARVFDRISLASYAAALRPVTGSTFLGEALLHNREEVAASTGRTAVIVFSDGKANSAQAALDACRQLMEVHLGQLCIYTVHIGDDEGGGQLLQEMAGLSACGTSWHASHISTPDGMAAMVRRIFFGELIPVNSADATRMGDTTTLLFGEGKSYIRPEYRMTLDSFANRIRTENLQVRVVGYADVAPEDRAAGGMAQQRAEAVRRALVERGVATTSITITTGNAPAVPEAATPSGAPLNRRVEVELIQ